MDSREHRPINCKQGKDVDAGMATSHSIYGNSSSITIQVLMMDPTWDLKPWHKNDHTVGSPVTNSRNGNFVSNRRKLYGTRNLKFSGLRKEKIIQNSSTNQRLTIEELIKSLALRMIREPCYGHMKRSPPFSL